MDYETRKGKTVELRKMKAGCDSNKCRRKCHEHFSAANRQSIFNAYWQLGDRHMQWGFIGCVVKKKEVAQRTATNLKTKNRNATLQWYFENGNGDTVQVCKPFFRYIMHFETGGGHCFGEKDRRRTYPKKYLPVFKSYQKAYKFEKNTFWNIC